MNPTCKDCGKEMSCGECRFWVPEKNDSSRGGQMKDGECRVDPPQILLVPVPGNVMAGIDRGPSLTVNGFFPRTRGDLFCGKFVRMTDVGKSTVIPLGKGVTGTGCIPMIDTIPDPDDGTP